MSGEASLGNGLNLRAKTVFFLARASTVRTELLAIRTVPELLDYIPARSLDIARQLPLFYWLAGPLIVMLRSIALPANTELNLMLNHLSRSFFWEEILQQAGLLSWLMSIVVLAKGFRQIQHKQLHLGAWFKTHYFELSLALLLGWSVLSFFFSDNRLLSWYGDQYRREGLRTYLMYGGVFLSALALRNWPDFKRLLRLLTAVSSLMAVLVLLNYEPLNQRLGIGARTGIFYNSNHYGYYLCLTIMSALLLYLTELKRQHRGLYLAAFLLQTAALVQDQSLGPYLAVVCGLIAVGIGLRRLQPDQLKRLLLVSGLFLLVSLLMNIYTNVLGADLMRLFRDFSLILRRAEESGRAGSGRWVLWTNGVRFIAEKPWFGYGPDNLGARYLLVNVNIDRPHNELIQLAASLGIPALLFYLGALAVLFKRFWYSRLQLGVEGIVLAGTIVAYFVSALFGNTMPYTTPYYLIFLAAAASILNQLAKTAGKQAE
ncbi:MAG: O-antigen ligase family protein [Saccharofermentanales bacterium]|jgi:O-antigen ligase